MQRTLQMYRCCSCCRRCRGCLRGSRSCSTRPARYKRCRGGPGEGGRGARKQPLGLSEGELQLQYTACQVEVVAGGTGLRKRGWMREVQGGQVARGRGRSCCSLTHHPPPTGAHSPLVHHSCFPPFPVNTHWPLELPVLSSPCSVTPCIPIRFIVSPPSSSPAPRNDRWLPSTRLGSAPYFPLPPCNPSLPGGCSVLALAKRLAMHPPPATLTVRWLPSPGLGSAPCCASPCLPTHFIASPPPSCPRPLPLPSSMLGLLPSTHPGSLLPLLPCHVLRCVFPPSSRVVFPCPLP